jgi:hypothetical protein
MDYGAPAELTADALYADDAAYDRRGREPNRTAGPGAYRRACVSPSGGVPFPPVLVGQALNLEPSGGPHLNTTTAEPN